MNTQPVNIEILDYLRTLWEQEGNSVALGHVYREQNTEADLLAREADSELGYVAYDEAELGKAMLEELEDLVISSRRDQSFIYR